MPDSVVLGIGTIRIPSASIDGTTLLGRIESASIAIRDHFRIALSCSLDFEFILPGRLHRGQGGACVSHGQFRLEAVSPRQQPILDPPLFGMEMVCNVREAFLGSLGTAHIYLSYICTESAPKLACRCNIDVAGQYVLWQKRHRHVMLSLQMRRKASLRIKQDCASGASPIDGLLVLTRLMTLPVVHGAKGLRARAIFMSAGIGSPMPSLVFSESSASRGPRIDLTTLRPD